MPMSDEALLAAFRAAQQICEARLAQQELFVHNLFNTMLSNSEVHSHLVDMVRQGIIAPSRIEVVIDEWYSPSAKQMQGEHMATAWRLLAAAACTHRPVGDTNIVVPLLQRAPALLDYMRSIIDAKSLSSSGSLV
jgi:hypothetical protein